MCIVPVYLCGCHYRQCHHRFSLIGAVLVRIERYSIRSYANGYSLLSLVYASHTYIKFYCLFHSFQRLIQPIYCIANICTSQHVHKIWFKLLFYCANCHMYEQRKLIYFVLLIYDDGIFIYINFVIKSYQFNNCFYFVYILKNAGSRAHTRVFVCVLCLPVSCNNLFRGDK